jgi:aminoglycoside phosphotransferase (APT) family kinase protein
MDPVDALLAAHRFSGRWVSLSTTGLANRVYATVDVVLRVATDHPDAIPDARTESVAAPVARDAGIRTPRLLAFDDSRALVNRPFSIWERVHGETLGCAGLDVWRRERVWHEVGNELAQLHGRVRACPDPHDYLDTPGYDLNLGPTMARLVDSGLVGLDTARELEAFLDQLAPYVSAVGHERCFVHGDVHEWNVMCTREGGLLALTDWGDAGWGDPVLDFVAVPLDMMSAAFDGYGANNRTRLGAIPEARIIWAKVHDAMDAAFDKPGTPIPLTRFQAFLDSR